MENKIKRKLVSIFKEMEIYEKIRSYMKSDFYIRNMNVYEVIAISLDAYLYEYEKKEVLSYFDWRGIRQHFLKYQHVLPPKNTEEYVKMSEFFDENGIAWASGHKFNEFNGWCGAVHFDIINGKITYSSNNRFNLIPYTIDEYIKKYNKIKEFINNNIDFFIIK